MGRKANSERFPVARGYRRLLVPLNDAAESFHALELACQFAADSHAKITALSAIEVPALLPLDAHLRDEEDAAQRLLERAGGTAHSYGVKVSAKIVRARDVGAAIVEQAVADHVELIVLGVRRAHGSPLRPGRSMRTSCTRSSRAHPAASWSSRTRRERQRRKHSPRDRSRFVACRA